MILVQLDVVRFGQLCANISWAGTCVHVRQCLDLRTLELPLIHVGYKRRLLL